MAPGQAWPARTSQAPREQPRAGARRLMSENIRLLCCDARELHPHLEGESVALVAADPPWQYSDGSRSQLRGLASSHYDALSDREIANILAEFYFQCQDDSYMVLWCTFPK